MIQIKCSIGMLHCVLYWSTSVVAAGYSLWKVASSDVLSQRGRSGYD